MRHWAGFPAQTGPHGVVPGPALCPSIGSLAIELVPLANATTILSPPVMLPNTPAGTRVIFEMSTLPAGSAGRRSMPRRISTEVR
jgi:hypothetical protein